MIEQKLEDLRKELNLKHAQNRKDIHDLRAGQQEMLDKQHLLEMKLVPVLGNGRPGLVEAVDEIKRTLQDMRVEQANNAGARQLLDTLVKTVEGLKASDAREGGVLDFLGRVVPILISLAALLVTVWALSHK
ncbi:MAG TPA: hypothetical protein VHB45_12865 [Alloacidobacterium sp.]|nr:hypothetical protein [Alloacidobacterium sp.]